MTVSPSRHHPLLQDLSALRYQALLQQTNLCLCSADRTGEITVVTAQFCRVIGRSQQAIVGKVLWQVLNDVGFEGGERLEHLYRAIVDQTVTGSQTLTTYGVHQGAPIALEWVLQPLIQAGNVVEIQAILTLQESTSCPVQLDPLTQLAEHLQQVFWVYDVEQQHLIYVSPACATLLQRSRADCECRSWQDWMGEVHPADLDAVLKVSRQLLRGTACEVTYRLMPPEGEMRWLMTRAVPVRNAAGRIDRIVAATEDVTDRQKQNRWLRLLESVIVNANDAVVITEAEPVQLPGPNIVYINQAFTRMMGYQPEEVVGKTPRILQGANTNPETLAHIRSSLKAWKPILVEIINYHKNGSEVWIELSIFPVKDETGFYHYWVAIQRDITERKQAEAKHQRQALRSQILTDLTLKIRRSLLLEEILQTTVTEVRSLLKVDRVLLFRRLGNGLGEVYSESVDWESPSFLGQEIEEIDFFAEPVQLYERSTVQTLDRLDEDHWQSRGALYLRKLGVRSLMVIPILQQESIWGWLIAHHGRNRYWSSFEVDLLQQLPTPLEVAITQGQLLQALQESEERFRTLANRAPVLLWSLDSHGHCVFCNQGFLDFLGMSSEVATRRQGWLEAVHSEDRNATIAHHRLALQTRESHEMEYRLRRSDGEYRWVLDRAVPQWTGTGEFGGLVISCWDLTDRKQVEDQMQTALIKERELSEMKSRLVSTTSHEFRTPLSTILSSADLLEFYGDRVSPDKQMEHIQRIQNAAVNMNNLLSDILLIERADAKKLKFEPTRIEIRSLCQAVIDELSWSASVSDLLIDEVKTSDFSIQNSRSASVDSDHLITPHNEALPPSLQLLQQFGNSPIQFISESDEELILANVDEKLIRQILMNLLTNAVKYSDPGQPIRLTLTVTDERLILTVQDWGIGIPAADQERLFEPFHRAMNVKTIPGNGLGLAIVQHSVQVHQGQIKINSTLGEGTIVEVMVPRWSVGDCLHTGTADR
jgi:PAS domain S-box-containing protein